MTFAGALVLVVTNLSTLWLLRRVLRENDELRERLRWKVRRDA